MPVSIPVVLMVAIVVSLLLQVPPLTLSVRVLLLPGHTVVVPLMAPTDGGGVTVTKAVAIEMPQLLDNR